MDRTTRRDRPASAVGATSLGGMVRTVVVAVAVLTAATSGALVWLTTELRRVTESLGVVLESVRLADEVEVALLLHARLGDAVVKRELEHDVRAQLARAAGLARADSESQALRDVTEKVERYFGTQEIVGSPAFEQAFTAIDALAKANTRRADVAYENARRLDALGNVMGLGAAIGFALFAWWLVWWLRSQAFRPLVTLDEAMQRFGAGQVDARCVEAGPLELRAMARRFNEMAAALGGARERQLTFLAALAHDLRNPISAVKMAAALRSKEGARGGDGFPALVGRQADRLERLVADFLDVARVEAGQLELRTEPVDLRLLVEEVAALFGAGTAHSIVLDVPQEEVVARCDPGRIEQVLNNLVSNAVKYSPDGGRIDISVQPAHESVTVSVADEGIGIRPEERETIFQPFRRGRRSRDDAPGTGLGLYTSRRIVEAHGGRIQVSGRPGRGSVFQVILPRGART